MRQRVVVNWSISSYFGWGVYGLNLALCWSNDPDIELMSPIPIALDELSVDPIQRRALEPFLQLSQSLQDNLPPLGASRYDLECPVLTDLDLGPEPLNYSCTGRPTIGLVFADTAQIGTQAIERAQALPLIVAGSGWLQRVLNAHGLDNVVTVLQGVDQALFHPSPAHKWLGDRFCVFSGGKVEYRKAQDIVLAAFRIFAKHHKQALLVTAWHCPWHGPTHSLAKSAFATPVCFDRNGQVDVVGWGVANGIDQDQILNLGAIPNREMPTILRQMDVAVFPNRCEGGTNLVAMECMACGVPVILSRNTGHLDLINAENCFPLQHQTALDGYGAGVGTVAGWGESSVDEIVETLEHVFANRSEARRRGRLGAERMTELTWKHTADRLKGLILEQRQSE